MIKNSSLPDHRLVKKILDGLFMGIQLVIMLGLAVKGQPAFMRGIAMNSCLWVGYIWFESKYNIYMSNYVRSAVMAVIIADGYFGFYLGYYSSSIIFDKLLHVFGTYAFALFAYVLLVQKLTTPLPNYLASILIVSLGVSLGTLFEIAEFMVDTWSNPVLPGQPSLVDTDLDLISDTVGALVAALHANYVQLIKRI